MDTIDLPQRHQTYVDHQTWEDSRIFVLLPASAAPPTIEDIVERLSLGGIEVEILSADAPSTFGPDEAQWEFEFLATLEGVDVREAWAVDDYDAGYESGERYNMWLIRTPDTLSGFDVLLGEVPSGIKDLVETSQWTLGLNGHCSTEAAETFRFQATVARFAAGDAEQLFTGALGTSSRDRGRLIYPSAVLITDTFHPEFFSSSRRAPHRRPFRPASISLIFHPIFAIDAYLLADKANSGEPVGERDFF
ncbi:MAG: hypothetical protein ACQEVA_00645 [Myxococcota bacterium]